jgi:sugar O-acyltransferase (sialic acid O-acetyltransferase NeuD family)
VVVLGASTALREVLGIVNALNLNGDEIRVVGVLDDSSKLSNGFVSGIPVLGQLDSARSLSGVKFIFAIGSLTTQQDRSRIQSELGLDSEDFINLIHPSAEVDSTASLGNGCIIHKGVSIGPGAQVGDFVVLAVNSAVGPDVIIENYSLVTSFVLLLTGVILREACYVGSMSCVIENVEIGRYARVAAGTIVNRSIPDGALAAGNPMRLLGRN